MTRSRVTQRPQCRGRERRGMKPRATEPLELKALKRQALTRQSLKRQSLKRQRAESSEDESALLAAKRSQSNSRSEGWALRPRVTPELRRRSGPIPRPAPSTLRSFSGEPAVLQCVPRSVGSVRGLSRSMSNRAEVFDSGKTPLQINAIHTTSPQACIQSVATSMPCAELAPLQVSVSAASLLAGCPISRVFCEKWGF